MSFSFWMYRGPADLLPVDKWETNLAEPIASCEEVCRALSELLPSIAWESLRGERWGWGTDLRYGMPFRVSLWQRDGGLVSVIATNNRASPATLKAIMDRFQLNFCYTDYGERRFPHAADDDWKPLQVS